MATARDEAHATNGRAVLTGRTAGWLGALLVLVGPAASQPYLSNLEADAQSALFATYAAPIERSEFIVDQGYHFRYYEAPVKKLHPYSVS